MISLHDESSNHFLNPNANGGAQGDILVLPFARGR